MSAGGAPRGQPSAGGAREIWARHWRDLSSSRPRGGDSPRERRQLRAFPTDLAVPYGVAVLRLMVRAKNNGGENKHTLASSAASLPRRLRYEFVFAFFFGTSFKSPRAIRSKNIMKTLLWHQLTISLFVALRGFIRKWRRVELPISEFHKSCTLLKSFRLFNHDLFLISYSRRFSASTAWSRLTDAFLLWTTPALKHKHTNNKSSSCSLPLLTLNRWKWSCPLDEKRIVSDGRVESKIATFS